MKDTTHDVNLSHNALFTAGIPVSAAFQFLVIPGIASLSLLLPHIPGFTLKLKISVILLVFIG